MIYSISNEVIGIWKIFSFYAKNRCDTGFIFFTLHCQCDCDDDDDDDDDVDDDDDNNS